MPRSRYLRKMDAEGESSRWGESWLAKAEAVHNGRPRPWYSWVRSERVLPLSTRMYLPFSYRFVAERQKPFTTAGPRPWYSWVRSERVLPLSTCLHLPFSFRFVTERQKPFTTAGPRPWYSWVRSERVLPLSTCLHLPFSFRFVAERQKPFTTAGPVRGIHWVVVSGFSRSAPAFICLFRSGSLLNGRSRSLQLFPSMAFMGS